MRIDSLPSLSEVVAEHKLSARRNLGQNFLFDLNLTTKIAKMSGHLKDEPIIEIGPGPGGLTRALLAQGCSLTVIEQDGRCLPILEDIAALYPGKLHIIHADALKQNYRDLAKNFSKKPKIVANLPYNIGTQLLLHWLLPAQWPPFYESLTLMFQKEVAQRITAEPNTEHYGRLSVLANWRTTAKIVMNIPPQAFTPPPKVMSSVVHIVPRENPLACHVEDLEKITKAAFGQRRKMLRQSLKNLGGNALLEKAHIEGNRRAETLTTEEFVTLANVMRAHLNSCLS